MRSTLRRNQEFREVSPLTGLPGNTRIRREIADRVRGGADYAVCYIDIDRFKSVNDVYGFVRGDEFIRALARSLHRAVVAAGLPPAFLGHIGGDDFVVVCTPEQVRPLTKRAVDDFETAADELYDPRTRSAATSRCRTGAATSAGRPGHALDRRGAVHRRRASPIRARSIAVASRDEDGGQEPARLVRGRRPAPRRPV